jgi:hypothetical protein
LLRKIGNANNFVLALALTIPLVLVLLALALDPVDKITIWYYIFRFGGAWINYRKRTKAAAVGQIKVV